MQQLAGVLVYVENEYVDPVDRSRLLEGSIKGMVATLDPHSAYLPPSAYRTFQADTEGEFWGIGVEVDFRNDEVTVIAPIEGSPAARAGIRSGDRIVAIDRAAVRGKSSEDLVQRMRGRAGTKVLVTIRRKDATGLLNFNVERQQIAVSSVAARVLRDDVAYVRIKQFQRGTHSELLEVLGELRGKAGFAGIILDLRNNPGGLVSEAVALADEFLESGLIYTTRHRGEVVDSVKATSGGVLAQSPLVVLVNEFSASASELVAGALQDNRRGTIVGAPTFGKGSVQSIIDLPDNAGLRLTTMRYYTPSGQAIQARGIRPDVLVEAAYVEDKSFGAVRESDLEGHLAAEGDAPQRSTKPTHSPEKKVEEETGVSPTHLGVARTIPFDPAGGPDFALSIGYQIVRGVLSSSRR
jgi:carboxyl-terminal processing protease